MLHKRVAHKDATSIILNNNVCSNWNTQGRRICVSPNSNIAKHSISHRAPELYGGGQQTHTRISVKRITEQTPDNLDTVI